MSSSSSSSSSALLSTTEHQAFMSFLHTVDHNDPDWQAFAHLAPPPNTALARATKDLIALHPPRPRPIAPAPASVPVSTPIVVPNPPPRTSTPRISKRRRPTPPPRSLSPFPTCPPSPFPPPPPAPPAKPTLLSTQQKKANHIQSEQKRRANIRRGYEALCDTVPALRAALRAEEPARRKRARLDDGDKVDGRAGPRSESVVLQKTIEHIRGLRDDHAALLERLERARAALGPAHPALRPQDPPLWERDWDGGKGRMRDGDDSDEDEDD